MGLLLIFSMKIKVFMRLLLNQKKITKNVKAKFLITLLITGLEFQVLRLVKIKYISEQNKQEQWKKSELKLRNLLQLRNLKNILQKNLILKFQKFSPKNI
nr:MAG TPA: hypothetical protein [Caudoviricetes sp.]